jgi:hypothetical protein
MDNTRGAVVPPRATSRAEATTDRSPAAGILSRFVFQGIRPGLPGQRSHSFQLKWAGIAMLRLALALAYSSAHSTGSASEFGCLAAALLGQENKQGPTVQEPILIRASLKIKFLVIGKLANNRS